MIRAICKPHNFQQETERFASELSYPVNVARNVAREEAATFFVLPADVELVPSKDTIKAGRLIEHSDPMPFPSVGVYYIVLSGDG